MTIETLDEAKKSQAISSDTKETPSFAPTEAHHPHHRKKTFGERKFDMITYGGFALLGNEASSLVITKLAEDNQGNARGLYAPFKKFFTDMKGKRFVPEYAWNGGLPKVIIALIGGMLMVPFIKNMEDHKGEKVRAYNRKHYGDAVDTDPAFIAAHKEMDEAPKQSWGSLWKGRIVTVIAAISVDGLTGWRDAPSTKLVDHFTQPDSKWRRYSSMDRIADQLAHKTLKLFKTDAKASPVANEWIQRGSWLLVLSSTLTVLFYASSKLFAKKRDLKLEHKTHSTSQPWLADAPPETTDMQATEAPATEHPKPQVSNITQAQRLAATPSATLVPHTSI